MLLLSYTSIPEQYNAVILCALLFIYSLVDKAGHQTRTAETGFENADNAVLKSEP